MIIAYELVFCTSDILFKQISIKTLFYKTLYSFHIDIFAYCVNLEINEYSHSYFQLYLEIY